MKEGKRRETFAIQRVKRALCQPIEAGGRGWQVSQRLEHRCDVSAVPHEAMPARRVNRIIEFRPRLREFHSKPKTTSTLPLWLAAHNAMRNTPGSSVFGISSLTRCLAA